jgi:hypothetical protein
MIFKLNDDGVPAKVDQYLLPHEKQVITVRRHPAFFVVPGVFLAVACAAAGLLTSASDNVFALGIVWAVCFIIFVLLVIRVLIWFNSYFVVTRMRVMFISGLVAPKVITVPLTAIRDLTFTRPRLGLLLGYGKFFFEAPLPGNNNISSLNYVPFPEQLYLEVCTLIFPDDSDEYYLEDSS